MRRFRLLASSGASCRTRPVDICVWSDKWIVGEDCARDLVVVYIGRASIGAQYASSDECVGVFLEIPKKKGNH